MPSSPSALIFPSIRDFSNELSTSDDQNTRASASVSVLLVNIQDSSSLRLIGWMSLLSKGLSGVFSSTTVSRHQFWHSAFFMVQLSQSSTTTGKTLALTIWTFVSRVMTLLFNIVSSFVISFLPRSDHLLISWLQSPSAAMLEPKMRTSASTSTSDLLIAMK